MAVVSTSSQQAAACISAVSTMYRAVPSVLESVNCWY